MEPTHEHHSNPAHAGEGEEEMDQTSISGTNLADIIALRGVGVGTPWGYGYGYGGRIGGRYSNLSSLQHGIECTKDTVRDANDCNRRIFGTALDGVNSSLEGLQRDNQFTATNTNVINGFNRVCEEIRENDRRYSDSVFQQELRNGDRLRDIERANDARFRSLEQCCCDAKLQACEDKSELLAEIRASEARSVERQLNAAQAELTALKTQVACGCTTGCTRPCHPHHHPR